MDGFRSRLLSTTDMLPVRSNYSTFRGSIWLVAVLGMGIARAHAALHPAVALVDRATIDMRTDPEASKRKADQALELLQKQPDADLEVQVRLILCDYFAERDTAAAEREIAAG